MYVTLLPQPTLKVGDMFFDTGTRDLYVIVKNDNTNQYHLVAIESGELYNQSFETIDGLLDYYEIEGFRILGRLKEY